MGLLHAASPIDVRRLGARARWVLGGADAALLDVERFADTARRLRGAYAAAAPFPHVVVDGLFPDCALDAVLTEFDTQHPATYVITEEVCTGKRWLKDEPGRPTLGRCTRRFIHHLNSGFFLRFLTELTGMEGLLSDPYYEGAGLHEMMPGSWLKVHADFNRHPRTGLDRRLNVIVYLNKDWRAEWGGDLELWSADMRRCEQRIAPVFGRTVVFSTSTTSYHGQPEPLRCPEGRTRKSLALYYYTNGRPDPAPPHMTLWQDPAR